MTPPASQIQIRETVRYKIKTAIDDLLSITTKEIKVQNITYIFIRTMSETARAKRALCFSKAVSS